MDTESMTGSLKSFVFLMLDEPAMRKVLLADIMRRTTREGRTTSITEANNL
jgi:hypothetical protein